MRTSDIYDLYEKYGDKLIKVRSSFSGRTAYINADTYVNDLFKSSRIWGQLTKNNESGFYFDIDDLELFKRSKKK